MGFWGTVPRGEHQVIVNQLETSENQKKTWKNRFRINVQRISQDSSQLEAGAI